MASYKNSSILHKSESEEFDKSHNPGSITPHSGIYRCVNCNHEIVSEGGKRFPPETHPLHPANLPIIWRLAVFAMHNSSK
jgi:hypothetical protein